MTVATSHAPRVTDDDVTFHYPDPRQELGGVKLLQELERPRAGPPFMWSRACGRWELLFSRPEVDRMEYQIEVAHAGGRTHVVCDPLNPLRAAGPFGERSVIEFPGYRPPAWVPGDDPAYGEARALAIPSRVLGAQLRLELWSSPGVTPRDKVPLLVTHDGPEYAHLSGLLRLLGRKVDDGTLPAMRVALLAPIERDQHYSASAAYARALSHEVLPCLATLAPAPRGRRMRAGMGASLGALAMLHAHRTNPAAFGGLFLQSGSFFRQRFDSQEAGFVRFRRISRFVGRVLGAEGWAQPVPVAMTCGAVEENLANNMAVRDALGGQGYDVSWRVARDAHNWISWRDAFDPPLVSLLRDLWA